MNRWLSILGIGEDGPEGLSPGARALIEGAEILIGSRRFLDPLGAIAAEKRPWPSPMGDPAAILEPLRGRRVCVLASGDPMFHGAGVGLIRVFGIDEVTVIPAASCLSLACARLGWSHSEVESLSLHGRPFETLYAFLQPGARLLLLSADGKTPAQVAKALVSRGFGASRITILERLGGPAERIVTGTAAGFSAEAGDNLNVVALECVADLDARILSRVPGLPDTAFVGDGTMTKHEVRAATLAALAPVTGHLLWDVGAGCGSVAVEWMRVHPRCRAVAIERKPERIGFIADNAAALGVPALRIVEGTVPGALDGLDAPDAVFIGGGIAGEGVLETCWNALKTGGRLVANVVTLDGERRLLDWYERQGGEMKRIAVARTERVGGHAGWRPMRTVTQYAAVKR